MVQIRNEWFPGIVDEGKPLIVVSFKRAEKKELQKLSVEQRQKLAKFLNRMKNQLAAFEEEILS